MLVGGDDVESNRSSRAPHTDVPMNIKSLDGGSRPPALLDDLFRKMKLPGGLRAGVLTSIGRDQAYMAGRRLRTKLLTDYAVLSEQYDGNDIYLRSTNLDRTIDTLQCLVAGIYGKTEIKEPLQINVSPLADDVLFGNTHYCPALKEHFVKVKTVVPKELPFVKATIEKLQGVVGDDVDIDIMAWKDHIVSRRVHGLFVPTFLEERYTDIDQAATETFEAFWTGFDSDIMHLTVGPLLNLIKTNLQQTENRQKNHKVFLYSCHDASLVPILKSLGIFDNRWPPFCATIEFDLLENAKHEKFVKVSYCGEELTLPNQTSPLIPLALFYQLLSKHSRTYEQFLSDCGNEKKELSSSEEGFTLPENVKSKQ